MQGIDCKRITIQGDPEERGLAYGQNCSELIGANISRYRAWFERCLGMDWRHVLDKTIEFLPAIENYCPELLIELRGIAIGCGGDFAEVLMLNCRSELMWLFPRVSKPVDGCTAAAILPEASENGHTLFAQNQDWYTWAGAGGIVLEVVSESHPDILTVTEAGQLARYGLNQAGLALGVNSLASTDCKSRIAVPSTFVRRRYLMQEHWADGLNAILTAEHSAPHHYLSVFAGGGAVGIECLPGKIFNLEPDGGLLVHSNHMLHPAAPNQQITEGDTLYRHRRLRHVLEHNHNNLNPELLKLALQDHFGAPFSICRHPDEKIDRLEHISTILSIVIDVTAGRMWVCHGQPCSGEFREHGWSEPQI